MRGLWIWFLWLALKPQLTERVAKNERNDRAGPHFLPVGVRLGAGVGEGGVGLARVRLGLGLGLGLGVGLGERGGVGVGV